MLNALLRVETHRQLARLAIIPRRRMLLALHHLVGRTSVAMLTVCFVWAAARPVLLLVLKCA